MEKIILYLICFFGRYLNVFLVNSTPNSVIWVLVTFLKKMLYLQITLVVYFGQFLLFTLNVNFNHKNDILWIWIQLLKRSLSNVVCIPIENFENSIFYIKSTIFYNTICWFLILEWYVNTMMLYTMVKISDFYWVHFVFYMNFSSFFS